MGIDASVRFDTLLTRDDIAGAPEERIAAAIREMIRDPHYPCVGAKSVVNRGTIDIAVFDRLADPAVTPGLFDRLSRFTQAPSAPGFRSFAAAFREPIPTSEEEFERLLWAQLDLLHDADDHDWDPAVSADPASPHFCFSAAGTAVFVIGMHPGASRLARRTPLPVLVFNLHAQFEELRASGSYDRVRDVVRRRDAKLQGSINPMMSDHGQGSEARQYSGRAVDDQWRPPVSRAES